VSKAQLRVYEFFPGAAGVGTIQVPGKIDLQQLLVITNTTRNVILYNFADATFAGTTVSFTRANQTSGYTTVLDTEDGYTTITLAVSTVGQNSTDTLQVFFEKPEQTVRPWPMGTDAFERTRVSPPQSMIDADFEYGMQPTKWLTLSSQRGIPSYYEIPGTDLTVTVAVTDASQSAGYVSTAESLITITTSTPHNFVSGTPITIRGFNSSVTGFDRAEGSFVVLSSSTYTFTYYAKGKVGFTNGDNLWTSFIQLRQAGFYTGAAINANINTIATATTGSGTNTVTLDTTTGFQAGFAVTFNQVLTNATGCNAANNYIKVGSTLGMKVGMPLYFSGSPAFGGLVSGLTLYVQTIVDGQTIICATSPSLSVIFVPTATVANGNLAVAGGGSFGGITAGQAYYVATVGAGNIQISNNIIYNTTITATNASLNSATFGTTNNMVVGETVIITGSTIGNLTAGTYYVAQILDSQNATLSTSLSGSVFVQSSASGSMSAQVGVVLSLTTASGFLSVVHAPNPTFTYSSSATAASFQGSLTGNVLSVTATTSGTISPGQGLSSGILVPSNTNIVYQSDAAGATAVASPTFASGGAAGANTVVLSSNTGLLTGQLVSGTNLPVNTFVTAVNGTTVTLSNYFTGQASGTYNFYTPGGLGTYIVSTSTGSISSGTSFTTTSTNPTITVNTFVPHGLVPGQTITVVITSESGFNNHTLAQGPYFVEQVYTSVVNGVSIANTFTYTARASGAINPGSTLLGTVYIRPDSFYTHRPLDGGVQLGTNLPSYGSQAVRMSKKYIRYQSGKGINFNTGLLVAPNIFVRSAVADGTAIGSNITIIMDDTDHGCQVGAQVTLSGVVTPGYSGTYYVSNILDERTLQVVATSVLGSQVGAISDPCLLTVNTWYGATVRSGTFDDKDGVFFQYDGQNFSVVRRASTFQLAGTVNMTVDSGQVLGLNTRFTSQLAVGDRVVIRGMSHQVIQVINDNLMYVNPQWRGGVNVYGIKMTKTIDYVVPQSKWNLDRFDGSNGPFNPSGYSLNINKMQMVGLQWTWYGAGAIDWMLRGPRGDYVFVHRLRNNNLNNEAWMRTGNMPVRYETINESARSYIVGSGVSSADTTIPLNDASGFPITQGTVYVDNEFIQHTGRISTFATAISSAGVITVASTASMSLNQPIVFMGASMGGIQANTTYYVNTLPSGTTLTISTVQNSGTAFTPTGGAAATGYMTINALIGCTRSVTITPWATGGYRTFTAGAAAAHTTGTGVVLVQQQAHPVVSHWGAAFVQDGGFDTDRSYIFNYQVTNVNISTKKTTAFAIRLAPSVSNALTGDLGLRELINRASFLLQGLESSSGTGGTNAAIVVEAILNPSNYPAVGNIQFNSLSSIVNPTGQPSFSQVAPGASMVFNNSITNPTTITSSPGAGTSSFTVASTTGLQVGDDVYFPGTTNALYGLTKISAINSSTITINQPLLQSLTSSSVVQFSRNTYAQPGETVFSFINSPANKDGLDLSNLKELINTPIGGRGTYPNGPDVLFINVYITQGAPINTNLVLRWGEAQA